MTPAVAIALSSLLQAAPAPVPAPAPAPARTSPPAAKSAAKSAATEDPLLAADLAILARLDQPFDQPRTFKDITAREVVDAVRVETGLDVEIDRQAVGSGGGWELIRVNCVAKTPRQALDTVATAISDGIREIHLDVAAGLPVFTDSSSAPRLAAVRHHDLRPILRRRDGRERPTAELVAEIADTLQNAIAPDSWIGNGGDGGWTRVLDSTLIVSATPARQQAIIRFLAGLEASLPSPTVLWRIRVVEVAGEVAEEDLITVLGSAAELDTLIAEGGARLVGAPKVEATRTEPASVKVGDGGDALEISIEPIAGSAAFAIRAVETRGGAMRSLTLRALDGLRSCGLVEGDGGRLLLEVLGDDPAAPR